MGSCCKTQGALGGTVTTYGSVMGWGLGGVGYMYAYG